MLLVRLSLNIMCFCFASRLYSNTSGKVEGSKKKTSFSWFEIVFFSVVGSFGCAHEKSWFRGMPSICMSSASDSGDDHVSLVTIREYT